MENLDHVPFLGFEGQPKAENQHSIVFYYFNQPFARVSKEAFGKLRGEIYNGKEWIADDVKAALKPHRTIQTLSDILGMKNYAMAQVYNEEELAHQGLKAPEKGILYLVLRHTPHLDFSKGASSASRLPKVFTTVLPLLNEDLTTLMHNMYTARFTVENGKFKRYSHEPIPFPLQAPYIKDIPDGTYEFYYGKAYQVHFGGITTELASNHPLYRLNANNVQLLFNLGMNWDPAFQPKQGSQAWPNRYVYFRNGDLYAMGKLFLTRDDPRLKSFIQSEIQHQETAQAKDPYAAFIDHGVPDESQEAFKVFGLKIPEGQYMALGDNHAMSADSRVFGFLPANNLQGVPDLMVWPVGDRLGFPAQKPYPLLTTPRLIIWIFASLIALASYAVYCYRLRKKIEL